MSYSRFQIGFSRNKKVRRLSDPAFRLWSSAIDFCRDQNTDGELEHDDIREIPRGPKGSWTPAIIQELVDANAFEVIEGGWMVHHYLDWQPSSVEVNDAKASARERMNRVRANRKRTPNESSGEVRSGSSNSLSNSSVASEGGAGGNTGQAPPHRTGPGRRTTFDASTLVPVSAWEGPDPMHHPAKASASGVDLATEEAKFRAYHEAEGSLFAAEQWPHKFSSWLLRAGQFKPATSRGGKPEPIRTPEQLDRDELREIETNARSGLYGKRYEDQCDAGTFNASAFRDECTKKGFDWHTGKRSKGAA